MRQTRRLFLKSASAIAWTSFCEPLISAAEPTLGLMVPVAGPVPSDALAMYPAGIRFVAEGLSQSGDPPLAGTLATYERLQERIVPAARALAEKGADAIVLLGTSVTFYKGAAHNQRLIDAIQTATKRPATTMSSAIVDATRAAGGKRLAVASGYTDDVSLRFRVFLEESGFEVVAMKGLGLVRPPENLSRADLEAFVVDVFRAADNADAVVLAFASTRTLELIAPLEKRCNVPMVSARPHAFWAGARLLGLAGTVQGFGMVLSKG